MLSLDPTTRAEMDAASTTDAKAQAVLAALSGAVAVRVYNNGVLAGSGTMAAPWATRAGNVLTIGEVASFTVTTGGNPDPATWYLRFESGSRWLRGSFGLSGADFTWSLPTWVAGQTGEIGTATVTSPGTTAFADLSASWSITAATITFNWNFDQGAGEYYDLGVRARGETVSIASLYTAPPGADLSFTLLSGPAGVSVDQATGAITFAADATAGAYPLEIDGDIAASLFEPAITGEPQIAEAEIYRTVDDLNNANGGPNFEYYNSRLKLRWENLRGDYTGTTDGADVPQGGSPFSTASIASGVGYKTIDMTTLVQRALTVNKGFFLTMTGTNGPSVTWGGRLSANPPLLSVTNTLGQTFNCPCILSCAVVAESTSAYPLVGTTQFDVSSSRNGIVQFDVSTVTGTVQSATMSLHANALFGGGRVLSAWELRPPRFQLGIGATADVVASLDGVTGVPANTIAVGLAAEVGESNLAASDGTPLHPDVYCAGDFTGTTFPTSGTAVAPRLNWGTITRTNTVEIVPDPEAPGTSYWRGTVNNVVPGSTGRGLFKRFYDFTPAVLNDPLYPIDVSKKVEECYVRAYFMWEPDFLDMTEGMKCGLGISLQYGYWVPVGNGYWQPNGGNSNSYGDGMKHLGDCHDATAEFGPSPWPGTSYYFHPDRNQYTYKGCMQFNLCGLSGRPTDPHYTVRPFQGYNYNIDANDVYGEGQSVLANRVPVRFQLGRWYCWEQYIKMNTLDFSQPIYGPKDGSFYDNYEANPDGIHRTWINGVLVDEKTNFRWRRNMDMGVDAAGVEWYFGGNGTTSLVAPMHFRINHVVVSKRYIGPRVRP